MGKPEGHVEKYLVKQVTQRGGECYKFNSGIRGVPDRITVLAGHTVFVEAKALGKKPDPLQVVRHQEIHAAGGDVRVLDNRRDVDAFIAELMANDTTKTTKEKS